MKLLTADEILDAQDIKYVEVEVPEWNGCVRMKTLSGEEAASFSDDFQADKKNAGARILVMTAVKKDGTPLFTEAHVERLRKKSLVAINRLVEAAMTLNGLRKEDEKTIKNG